MKLLVRLILIALMALAGWKGYGLMQGLEIVNQTRRELQVAVMHFTPHVPREGDKSEDRVGKWVTEGWTAIKAGEAATVYRGKQEKVFVHLKYAGSIDCFAPGQHFSKSGAYVHAKSFVLERNPTSSRHWIAAQVEGKELGHIRPTDMKQSGFYWEDRFYEIFANTRLVVAY